MRKENKRTLSLLLVILINGMSVTNINVCNGDSYIVFNFSISNSKSIRRVFREHDC